MSLLALQNRLRRDRGPRGLTVSPGDHLGKGVVGAVRIVRRGSPPDRARGYWTQMPGRTRAEKRANFVILRREAIKRRRLLEARKRS